MIGFKGDVITADLFECVPDNTYFDAIFHEAAITDTTVMDQRAMMEQNVEAFKNLLSFAAENGIKKVIYASSAATYGNGPVPNVETQPTHPENVYGFSKAIMDNVARQFVAENHDMTGEITIIEKMDRRMKVAQTDAGIRLQEKVDELLMLLQAYRSGAVAENHSK